MGISKKRFGLVVVLSTLGVMTVATLITVSILRRKKCHNTLLSKKNTAIVVQGPITPATHSILEYYTKHFSNVILSTWKPEVDLSKYGLVAAIFNDIPLGAPSNRPLQRLSTCKGLEKAKELGFERVLKCRTDHFVKNTEIVDIFNKELDEHPIDDRDKLANMKSRKIILNTGTTLEKGWGHFHASDFLMFGHIDDMIQYWTYDNPHYQPFALYQKDIRTDRGISPEPELNQLWMKYVGMDRNLPFEEVLAKYWIIVNAKDVQYDIVKNVDPTQVMDHKTDWNSRRDSKTVDRELWMSFLKTYNRK